MGKEGAESLLSGKKAGTFLVRLLPTRKAYMISYLNAHERPQHAEISVKKGLYAFAGDGQTFTSLNDVVKHSIKKQSKKDKNEDQKGNDKIDSPDVFSRREYEFCMLSNDARKSEIQVAFDNGGNVCRLDGMYRREEDTIVNQHQTYVKEDDPDTCLWRASGIVAEDDASWCISSLENRGSQTVRVFGMCWMDTAL